MNKIYLALAVALAAAGCAKEQTQAPDAQAVNYSIDASIDAAQTSRTELDTDGLKVLWSAGDNIGVFSTADNNVAFGLKTGAGSNTGTFEGKLTQNATPTYAYYPYASAAGTSAKALAVTVAAEQSQIGTTAGIGANDFKVGSYSGGKFQFRNKLALLWFRISDTETTELAGLTLAKLTLAVAGKHIAGSFTADLTAPDAALTATAGISEVTLNFTQTPALSGEVAGWCMVNPTIKSGDELTITLYAGDKKAELKVKASQDYTEGKRYTMPVTVAGFIADGSMTVTTNKTPLPKPVVTVFRKSHAQVIAEFDFEQDYPYGRKYNIQLLDAEGNLIREHKAINLKYGGSGGTNFSYLYNRYAFGDLNAGTKYTVRAQLVSQNATLYADSEWGEAQVTTEALPTMGANVLLYKDFDDIRWGGNPVDLAWGPIPSGSQAAADFTNEDILPITLGHPVRCMEDVFGTKLHSSFFDAHWAGWTKEGCTGIFPVNGALKFGSGGAKGILATPTLGDLGLKDATASVTISFKAHAYCEPNLKTGSYETTPNVLCGADFKVLIFAGEGTFPNGENAIVATNKTPAESGADAKKTLVWTEHSLTITGATPQTRIAVSTENTTMFRMWLDDLKITKN